MTQCLRHTKREARLIWVNRRNTKKVQNSYATPKGRQGLYGLTDATPKRTEFLGHTKRRQGLYGLTDATPKRTEFLRHTKRETRLIWVNRRNTKKDRILRPHKKEARLIWVNRRNTKKGNNAYATPNRRQGL